MKVFLNEGFALLLVGVEDEVLTNAAVGSLIWNVKLWSSEGWAFKIDFTKLLPKKMQVIRGFTLTSRYFLALPTSLLSLPGS